MMTHRRMSAYTPSNMDPMLLKRIFVQRETLLDSIVNWLTASMTTGDKHHVLLVGPRGSGKTHLVSLAVWELTQNPELSDSMRIAWLGEDDAFSGLIHFAFAIARSLADEYPDEFPSDFKSAVRGLPNDDAAIAVLNTVIKNLKHRHLLVVTENLDQTFQGLGEMGQKKLRAFLQETRRIATLATTQQLFAGVSSRKEAFFGFFSPHHLDPLSVEDAQQLIRKIAIEQHKTDLVQFLDSNHARYRIRALHHLAGGNYRMYVLLAEFLTRDTLDDLVAAFETLAEEMTPYFQERMRSLPDQQRQLIQCLCDTTGAMTVKEIAEETFIAEGNCSKQLGNLKAKGYVRSEKRGKESYYDMAEPLMRLCLEVKNQRGRPLKLVARFLKAWFPEDKLKTSLKKVGIDPRSAEYCKAALQSNESFEATINSKLMAEIANKLDAKEFHRARELADELSVSDPNIGSLSRAMASNGCSDYTRAIAELTKFLDATDESAEKKAIVLVYRGMTFMWLGDLQAALKDYTAIIEMPNVPFEQKVQALVYRGMTYGLLDDTQAARADFNNVIEMPDVASDQKAKAMVFRGISHWHNRNWQASASDFEQAIAISSAISDIQTLALFALPQPMVAIRPLLEVEATLSSAFETGDNQSYFYGGTSHKLLFMIIERGTGEWADYIAAIAPLYKRHGVGEKLGQGVTQSIQFLDEGDFSASQLDLWNQAWQIAGKDCEELEIPLACLDAAVEILKSDEPTDRPLFRLPLEVRELVRPLLRRKLESD